MKKKNILIYSVVFFLGLLFSGCDEIDPPYTTNQNGPDTTTVKQKVYVEYFTGHRCVNCPTESAQLRFLKTQYGDRLVYISVHSGYFAEPYTPNYEADYRTPTGNELDANFNVTTISTPNALINRKVWLSDIVVAPSAWSSAVADALLTLPVLSVSLETSLSGSNIEVSPTVKPLTTIDGVHMISVYIVEDSIQSYQKNNNPEIGTTPDIPEYNHRYVLRTSMNGTFGDTLFGVQATEGEEFIEEFSYTAPAQWNKSHLYAVCFIYNADTDEVIQVEMKKIE